MRKIVQYVEGFYRSSLSPPAFLVLCIFLATSIAINFSMQFETRFIDIPAGSLAAYCKYVGLYLVPFGFAFALEVIFKKNRTFLRNPVFWCLLFGAPLLFATREVSAGRLIGLKPGDYWTSIISVVIGWIVAGLPIYLYWRATRESGEPFFGFTRGTLDLKPYWCMLAVMVPLTAAASFTPEFLESYPRAETISGLSKDGAPWPYYAFFELIYGLDFVFIEFFFRGFIVLAMGKICGPSVILPMTAFYVFIHFQKPLGEAISSFFGGMLLGIISYETRSIFGGLIVHLGVAWLMELFAFVQKAVR